jgi:hypothetical protein
VRRDASNYFAFDYQLLAKSTTGTPCLSINGGRCYDLHDLWSHSTPSANELHDPAEIGWVSDPFQVTAKTGDQDGINLPWFRKADAVLLFNAIHHDDVPMPVRFLVFSWKIQLWPESQRWENAQLPAPHETPLLELLSDNRFLAPSISSVMPTWSEIEAHFSDSPSQTFAVRRAIQAVLVPTGLWIYHNFNWIGTGLGIIFALFGIVIKLWVYYSIVILLAWILSGRPKFGPWAQSFILTRFLYAKVYDAQSRWPTHDEHAYDVDPDERRPRPLRTLLDFFRSKQPLDDLLVTFESTKHLVEPIKFGRSASTTSAVEGAMPRNIKLDISNSLEKPGRARHKRCSLDDAEKGSIRGSEG